MHFTPSNLHQSVSLSTRTCLAWPRSASSCHTSAQTGAKRQYVTAQGGGGPATVRYRQGGSYFGRDAPAPGDVATQQARRTVVDLVPLTYPSAHWSEAETEKLREGVQQPVMHKWALKVSYEHRLTGSMYKSGLRTYQSIPQFVYSARYAVESRLK